MQVLKLNANSQYVPIFLADQTDGYTGEPNVTSPTIYLSKNGANSAAAPNDGTWVQIDATNIPGAYWLRLNATDTNTEGPMLVDVFKSGTSRHFTTCVYVSSSLTADIAADTAAILTDTGTDGVVLSAATQAAIVDAIYDEVNTAAAHNVTNSGGVQWRTATAAADPWSAELPGSYASGTAGYAIGRAIGGAGMTAYTVTIQDNDDVAVEGVRVDVYDASTPSESAFITTGTTNSSGVATFYLVSGSIYYLWRYKRGYSFADPVTITVS